jgi:hypothetical protein
MNCRFYRLSCGQVLATMPILQFFGRVDSSGLFKPT